MAIHATGFKSRGPQESRLALSHCSFLAIVLHAPKETIVIKREESP